MNDKIVLYQDQSRIDSIIGAYERFAAISNQILEAVPDEMPDLVFDFNAEFLLGMYNGKVKAESNHSLPSGGVTFGSVEDGWRKYHRLVHEANVKAYYADSPLKLDVAFLLQAHSPHEFSEPLKNAFVELHNMLRSNVNLNMDYFKAVNGRVCFTREGRDYVIGSNSQVIEGSEATEYRQLQDLVDQMNEWVNKQYGKQVYIALDTLLQIGPDDKGNPIIQLMPTCVPSQRRKMIAARVAMHAGMMREENPMANPHVAARHILGIPDTSSI